MRNYRGAIPEEFESSPTPAEFAALAAARLAALGKGRGGIACVPVHDGSGNSAHAMLGGPGDWLSGIWRPDPHAPGGWHHIKKWRGIPEPYNDFGIREGHMSRHNVRGGPINIYGPPVQQHVIVEEVHLFHQREIHHHQREDEHIHHGAPRPPTDIYVEASRVNYRPSEQVIQQVHKPKSFLGWIFSGPERKQQHALPPPQRQQAALPPPQETYRGNLQAIPAPQQRAPEPQQYRLAPPQQQPLARQPMMIEHKPAVPSSGWFSTRKQRV